MPAARGERQPAAGAQRPLFLIHDMLGEVADGAALLQHLDLDVPAYGLLEAMPHEELPRTIEALARRCILEMRALQTGGPYRLAGLSSGGIVAYEIAVQLIGEDQEVEFLGLINSVCPTLRHDASPITRGPSIEAGAGQIWHDPARFSAYLYAQQDYAVQQLPIHVHVFSLTQDFQPADKSADPLQGWDTILPRNQLHSIRVWGTELGRALGEAIREAANASSPRVTLLESSYSPLVSVQVGRRGGVPIFCAPGAGNSVTDFTAWAHAVGEGWRVHGLQPRGVSGDLVPHSTVQAAALQYLDAIDKAHPHGPLHLVGHSFGGWIVLELACLLRARRRTIASLTIFDGDAPDTQGPFGSDYTATEVLMELVDVIELASDQPLGIMAADLAPLDNAGRLQLLHQALVRVGMLPTRSKPGVLVGIVRTFGTALRTTYRPSAPYADPLRLVTVRDTRKDASSDERRREKQVQDWQRWAPRLSSWCGPGNHMTLLDHPNVLVVADWWRSGFQLR